MTEKGFDCEHNRHRWEQCEACAEERGYRAGIEACIAHLREKCAGTWAVNTVADELAAMKERLDALR